MGNKMCKKKTDNPDNPKSPSPFDRIFNRLHIKPNSWKSDSHLNTKQVNRNDKNSKDNKNGCIMSEPRMMKSKSTDWTEADLEVPEKEEAIHLKNPQLSFIFNDNTTPTPPPRKHKKSIREKIESVAKNSFQALQSKKSTDDTKKVDYESRKPVEEPLCVKKIINYGCPCEDLDHCTHRERKQEKQELSKNNQKRGEKDSKRKKNLSVVSLPNYSELKFSIANSDDSNLRYIDASVTNSANSLPGEVKKTTSGTTGKLENYMTRCRSFGSLLNNKLKTSKEPADVESDDSFGGLEDWDLRILEHYNPKDASLPRPRKLRNDNQMISDIEQLIVADEEIEVSESVPPVRPIRRSESLIKKTVCQTEESEFLNDDVVPLSAETTIENDNVPLIPARKFPIEDENNQAEHSSLMRILQEYSIKDLKKKNGDDVAQTDVQNSRSSAAPRFQKQASLSEKVSHLTANFINVEKQCVS